jgi:trk system potassium uptake protein TrkA
LDEVREELDVQTIVGEGCNPRILQEAGVDKSDLIVSVTDRDEVNILACLYARAAGVKHTVARVAGTDYRKAGGSFDLTRLGIDLVISAKEECALEIYTVLRMPGAQEAVDLLGGRVLAVGFKVHMDSPIIMQTLGSFPNPDLLQKVRFIAVMRGKELILPRGDTQMLIGDDIYAVGEPRDVSELLEWAYPECSRFSKVVIAGGGEMGLELARLMEKTAVPVVLVEKDAARAEECSKALAQALVIKGNALDPEALEEAGIVGGTAVVALTGNDENNIMVCLVAAKAGATFTLAEVAKSEYVPIIASQSLLDRAVSSHMSMINAILHFIRGKNVKAAALLHSLPGELLEVVIPADSRWARKPIRDLRIPDGILIATVLRGGEIKPATGDLVLQVDDRLVLFAQPKAVSKVESMFHR